MGEIHPDEIFLDSKNLPSFDMHQFEGRLEKPISLKTFLVFGIFCALIGLVFLGRVWNLQIIKGTAYAEQAANNSLRQSIVFAMRGSITDRNDVRLAWNDPDSSLERDFAAREYIDKEGFGHILGFLKYPAKDNSGFYYREHFEPQDGAEEVLQNLLGGQNGLKLTETDVSGHVVSESVTHSARDGEKVSLSIDSRIQEKMYTEIKALAESKGFTGGAGAIMDIHTGELLVLTSYPEYEPSVMTEGRATSTIAGYAISKQTPFLDRFTEGLYAPGSIVKPFLAFAALEEGIITPEKEIVSEGKLVIPNPYFPDQPSVFLDWKAHGATTMREAIAVSSDVYFYQVGGGFGNQQGLGIARIEKYMKMFGFARPTGINLGNEAIGNIPNPEWKMKTFDEEWRLGNTYHTAIGQYGTQVTPIQAIRATAALANEGTLVTPTILKNPTSVSSEKITIKNLEHLKVAQEGMRMSVTEGTSMGLSVPYVKVAGKTGTAEIGTAKDRVNSWTVGYFPYENPRYAYTIVMESGPRQNLVGATSVMRLVLDFMHQNTPEYLE